jgi:Lon protease-like protein
MRPHRRFQHETPDSLPATLPIFPLAGAIVLPRAQLPLNIFEDRYIAMIDDALAGARLIGMVQPREGHAGAGKAAIYGIGGAGRITQFAESGDGRYLITLTGVSRFAIRRELDAATPYRQVVPDWAPFAADLADRPAPVAAGGVDRDVLLGALEAYLVHNGLEADWDAIRATPDEPLVNSLATIAPVAVAEKQALLEAASVADRARVLVTLIELALASPPDGDDDISVQ